MRIDLTDREFNAVLAGLRFWQRCGNTSDYPEWDIATDGSARDPISEDEIDSLCERINTQPTLGAPASPAILALVQEATSLWADRFDAPTDSLPRPGPVDDGDRNISGADLVDWFCDWRLRAKPALETAGSDTAAALARALAEADPLASPALRQALAGVLPLAESHLDDWETGIEDGTYDTAAECTAARQAVDAATAILAKPPAPKATLAIVVEGGLVQSIVSDAPKMALAGIDGILVIDYDADSGDDDGDVTEIEQADGSTAPAYVHSHGVDRAAINLAAIAENE